MKSLDLSPLDRLALLVARGSAFYCHDGRHFDRLRHTGAPERHRQQLSRL
jgi:hypothetical protein